MKKLFAYSVFTALVSRAGHLAPENTVISMNKALDIPKDEGGAQDLAKVVCEYVNNKKLHWNQLYATGFNHIELKKIKQLCPQICLVPAIVCMLASAASYLKKIGASAAWIIDIGFAVKFVKSLQNSGFKIWFANIRPLIPADFEKYKVLNFNGAILNRPLAWER